VELTLTHRWKPAPWPQRIGDALRRHRGQIAFVQWCFVAIYLVLLIVPAVLPQQSGEARVFNSLAHFAEALFWGLWWPGVILSTMLVGQFWCGLLCPDGTLTEFVSRHGKAGKIPTWLRWPALPMVLFALVTLFEYAFEAHYSARGTLLAVGATTLLAIVCGMLYGRGKRVWCRYACPVGSIFSLLARCAVLHYRVDRAAWDAAHKLANKPAPKPVDCPPLLDIRRLTSNEKCNMCGRCSGHRGAVTLAWRPLGDEIRTLRDDEIRLWEAVGIVFILIGLLYGAMHWKQSFWHAQLLISSSVFTAHPALANVAAVLLPMLVLGGGTSLLLYVSAAGKPRVAARLAYGLIPLGGLGLFLGAAEHSLLILRDEGLAVIPLLPWLRGMVLLLAAAWSTRTGWEILCADGGRLMPGRRAVFFASVVLLALTYQFAPDPFVRH
jgi:hypothetical protein